MVQEIQTPLSDAFEREHPHAVEQLEARTFYRDLEILLHQAEQAVEGLKSDNERKSQDLLDQDAAIHSWRSRAERAEAELERLRTLMKEFTEKRSV